MHNSASRGRGYSRRRRRGGLLFLRTEWNILPQMQDASHLLLCSCSSVGSNSRRTEPNYRTRSFIEGCLATDSYYFDGFRSSLRIRSLTQPPVAAAGTSRVRCIDANETSRLGWPSVLLLVELLLQAPPNVMTSHPVFLRHFCARSEHPNACVPCRRRSSKRGLGAHTSARSSWFGHALLRDDSAPRPFQRQAN